MRQRQRTPEEITAEIKDATDVTNRPKTQRPDPDWIRGRCPECGGDLVSNMYHVTGRGYLLVWKCWEDCGYAREL